MTQGQMVFLSGVILLIATIILAIIFLIKKPRYSPEKFNGLGSGASSRFRNGYPTDRLTKRYPSESEAPVQPATLGEETARLKESSELAEETERLIETSEFEEETDQLQGISDSYIEEEYSQELDSTEKTESLQDSSVLSEKTERLTTATEFGEATAPLQETGTSSTQAKSTEEETQN